MLRMIACAHTAAIHLAVLQQQCHWLASRLTLRHRVVSLAISKDRQTDADRRTCLSGGSSWLATATSSASCSTTMGHRMWRSMLYRHVA